MRKRKIHVNQSDEDNGAETYTQKNKKHSRTSKRNSKAVAPVEEPKFYCPICMCPLTEETSTKCGHIFCNSCIKKAISHQPSCPSCRKHVTASDLIRIYLPTTE
ncbi:hypothetical protein EUTSA_v10021816mg [Eutrema salsugineum]|uniref:RING-type domain-containing protein n=2 Tax=Eutrema salsugineum TaxID=72664 RepID=V4LFN4_EUTSA|nr:hypothetical protein EUTSA_v10021816mg [Eutrema salsugineum]